MIALLGFLTIFLFLALILTKRVSVIVALILVPLIFALIGGFGKELGALMLEGITGVAPTGIMLGFAILYFGVMNNAGLFDPVIRNVLKLVKGDPLKIVIGTAVITMLTHLDGSGASTFLITIPALLPLYEKMGMSRLVLAGTVALGAGTMNMVPWGGPTARAASALELTPEEIFNPLLPAMIVGLLWVLFAAYMMGKKERKRVGIKDIQYDFHQELTDEEKDMRRPKLFWFNLGLTIITIIALIKVWLPLPVVFMVSFAVALLVNYPKPDDQQNQIKTQAFGMITVVSIIFAAGIFTGILNGTGMIEEMANALVALVPQSMGNIIAVIVAITSMPFSLLFTPDAFYFGVLPVLSETAAAYGVESVEIARAGILGQMTTGFPLSPLTASTFLLVGLANVELGDHQKFIFKWAFGTTIIMTIVALIIRVI
ncbi:CitMHS family transporter [Pseudalkalibacillus salsuginis]|uniref:CitMHS family transporter n=1 Tax=Pseudalkalibacillus salsuginis TaxID=2910972 RepID=UPI001F241B1F|nr:citrate:proton symporter [Pseudalkalibacillus salsuginis]MCF6409777.1 citrate:proton symporter [Pseudalkalibacillus salsuginis]